MNIHFRMFPLFTASASQSPELALAQVPKLSMRGVIES
jgi:hypothetical protein